MKNSGKDINASFHFYEKLYFRGRIDDKERMVSAVMRGGRLPRVYVVALAENQSSVFDIYECTEDIWPLYQRDDVYIVGICRGRANTMELITEIFDGDKEHLMDFRSYWKDKSYLPIERLSL